MKIQKIAICVFIALFITINAQAINIRSIYNIVKKPVKTLAYSSAGAISTCNAIISAYAIKKTLLDIYPNIITQFVLQKKGINIITYTLLTESFFSIFTAYMMFKKAYETITT